MNLAHWVDPLLDWLWRASWQASVLVGLVLLVQTLLRSKLTPRWRSAFWWLVLIRLVMPVVPESPWSLFNYTRLDRMHAVTAPLMSRAIGSARSSGAGRRLQPAFCTRSDRAKQRDPDFSRQAGRERPDRCRRGRCA